MHNVCLGECGGSSENPGVCTTSGCTHEGRELMPCDCTDTRHGAHGGEEQGGEEKTEV